MTVRKPMQIVAGTVVCLLLFFMGGVVVCSYLPALARAWLLPELRQETGMARLDLTVRKLDLSGLDVANIAAGNHHQKGIKIDTVRIGYSPQSLINRKIKTISISGADLYFQYKDGRLIIPGLYPILENTKAGQRKRPAPAEASNAVAYNPIERLQNLGVETIRLNHAVIHLGFQGNTYTMPLSAWLRISKEKPAHLSAAVTISPCGQTISAKIDGEIHRQRLALTLAADHLRLDAFADWMPPGAGVKVSGMADGRVTGFIDVAQHRLSQTEADLRLKGFSVKTGAGFFTHYQDAKGEQTLQCRILQKDADHWQASVSAAAWKKHLTDAVSLGVEAIESEILLQKTEVKLNGKMALFMGRMSENPGIRNQGQAQMRLETVFSAVYGKSGKWGGNLRTVTPHETDGKPWHFMTAGFEVQSRKPVFRLTGEGQKKTGKIHGSVGIEKIFASRTGLNVRGKALLLTATGVLEDRRFTAEGELDLSGFQVETPELTVEVPDIALNGNAADLFSEDPVFTGRLAIPAADAFIKGGDLDLSGITIDLPLAWPEHISAGPGTFHIKRLMWDQKKIGALRCRVQQKKLGVRLDGSLGDLILPGMVVKFSGSGGIHQGRMTSQLDFDAAPRTLAAPLDLGMFLPKAGGWMVDGTVGLSGKFVYDGANPTCRTDVNLKNGRFAMAKKDLKVEGIDTRIFFPNLLSLKTAPRQELSFASASMSNLRFENGHMAFQLESGTAFFIEKARFAWCGGHVEAQALRIMPEKNQYNMMLYCDRLNLAEIMMQLGVAEAEGEGTVSGKIPLKYDNGRWIFDDGFLFSSPGVGGRIKMADTRKWDLGASPDSKQYTQVQLAQEAVKDYQYNWAKLGFNTRGQDLVLKLNFNGRPTNPIPFAYKKDLGRFVRIEAKDAKGIRPEVFLNLNFKLPLNELFRYRELLEMIP